jgi:nitrogen fixation protein FixH
VKFLGWLVCGLLISGGFAQQQPTLREGNFDIRFEPTAVLQTGTEIRFDITVKDALRNPVHGATVTLQIETTEHENAKTFRATEIQNGLYMAKLTFSSAGRWNVNVEVRRGDQMSARTIEYYVPK